MASSAPGRAAPRCPVQAACGGCPLMQEGDAARAELALGAFERLARGAALELPAALDWTPAPAPFGYRNRLRLRVDERGEPSFFNREKADDCAVLGPGVLEAMAELRAAARADRRLLAPFTHLEVRDRDALGRFGNFALPLLAAGFAGRGVERHAGAVAAARRVASERGLEADGFACGDARSVAASWALAGARFDAVVADPPRAGLGAGAEWTSALAARWLVLCSCRLETLCADLRRICADGFAIQAVRLFDMFPQTRHVEAVVWLERRCTRHG